MAKRAIQASVEIKKFLGTFSNKDGDCNDNANMPVVSELRLEKTPCIPFEFASI